MHLGVEPELEKVTLEKWQWTLFRMEDSNTRLIPCVCRWKCQISRKVSDTRTSENLECEYPRVEMT